MGPYRLGVDIGGTFTDFALLDENTGRIQALKYPSDRARPASSVFSGLAAIEKQYGASAKDISYFTHGTTLAVNTILQYNGAKCALFVTRGLRDILYLGRHRLPDIFNFFTEMPTPLVPRSRVLELNERCLANGTLAIPIDEDEVRAALERLVAEGVESVAVGFLHSYQNPRNELVVARIAAEIAPQLFISLSSQVWPQMREYERTLIGTMNAYVGGRMEAYFSDLETGLRRGGLVAPVLSTKSNGGLMTAQEAARRPVDTLMSGPAAGAIGAAFVGRAAGYDRLITLDMGGTSTDISIIDGTPRYSTDNQIGDLPVIMPAVDVTSIGAGGGSVAWLDTSGMLKVGPHSAGAFPGPACYGLGNKEPTLTDAYVCLGIVEPGDFAGGKVKIDRDKAMAAVGRLADVMGARVEEVAESIIRIATSHIFAVLVPLLARKGVNYEQFALLPFGGAGAMHGFLAAREIGIKRVIVPLHPGVLCAIGALVADVRRDFVRTVHQSFWPSAGGEVINRLQRAFSELELEGDHWLDSQGLNYLGRNTIWSVDMRYLGQSFEISVPVEPQVIDGPDDGQLRQAFYNQYRQVYGHADETAEIEVRDIRVGAVGITPKPKLELIANASGERGPPQGYRKPIFHDGKLHQALVIGREALSSGIQLQGPVIIKQYDTTTFVPSGYRISVDDYGNLIGEADDEQ